MGSISYLLFGLGALPAGMIADRFGSRRVLISIPGLMLVLLMLFWRFEERESEGGLSRDEALPQVKTLILPFSLLYVSCVFSGLCYSGIMTFFPPYFVAAIDPTLLHLRGLEVGGLLTTIALLAGGTGL